MEKNDFPVYFNAVQMRVQQIAANTTVVVAGRRTGKSYGCGAPFALRNMQRMPGSTGGIVVPTFKHGLTNTLPGLFAAWKTYGFIEGLHYVVGKKPLKSFKEAIVEPREYEHVISFYNGSRAILISQDRPGSSNSLTLDWVLVDEAKFIDYQKLKDETLPANGGTKIHFGKHSCHHSLMIMSDLPQSSKGSWFTNYKEKHTTTIINLIETLLNDEYRLRAKAKQLRASGTIPPKELLYKIRHINKQINQLRSQAVMYVQYSTIENIDVVGEKYIRDMKRDLTPLTFMTSILCQEIGIAKDGFYSSMRESHKYNADDFEFLDGLGYGHTEAEYKRLIDSRADKDVDTNSPICIGMDYNANINWIVAGQPRDGKLFVIKSFYVKFERKLRELVDDFCEYYKNHRCKKVIFYYDSTALGSNYAVSNDDFKKVICDRFRLRGWKVDAIHLGHPMRHNEKYEKINAGFSGQNSLMPMFNEHNNEDLILAIQSAGVERGRNGFRKHKAGEKLAESEENLLEHRTDGTDAFDTLYLGCLLRPKRGAARVHDTGGVM